MIFSIIQSIANFLFPLRCNNCGKSGSALCNTCLASLAPTPLSIGRVHSIYSYKSPLVKKLIKSIKYSRNTTALSVLIDHAHSTYNDFLKTYPTTEKVLVPIPKHSTKEKVQGYNQSTKIAQALSRTLHIPLAIVLTKPKYTQPQAQISDRVQRLQNVSHTMQASEQLSPHILYIVIDDVYTTGATITEAFRALKENGATTVCAITLAHGKY